MKKNYIFHSTFFDVELLRVQTLTLYENNIDFKVIQKSSHGSAKAPLSVLFEAELHVIEADFDKADELIGKLNS